ncbi:MAG: GNAT family N-acetyltransferase [Planctomycetes bacterium]|jgi:RimJ/RimL family protein N-acetyltransferase|nr:GNAT family N-acetyltransferase [Planctomycetota bacterium]
MDPSRKLPRLRTPRLTLRPFATADGPAVRRLAGDAAVASTTLRIPHPYGAGVAEEWIRTHAAKFAEGDAAVFAIERRRPKALVGAVELDLEPAHRRAELGYWIGKAFWGRGYATEAAREALRFGFEDLALEKIAAHHFARNPASGRVMRKLGMSREGRLRRHVLKEGAFEDLEMYGILREEFPPRETVG